MGSFSELDIERTNTAEDILVEIHIALSLATPRQRKDLILKAIKTSREYEVLPEWLGFELLFLDGIENLVTEGTNPRKLEEYVDTDYKHRKIFLISKAYDNVKKELTRPSSYQKKDIVAEVFDREISTEHDSKKELDSEYVSQVIHRFRKIVKENDIELGPNDLLFIKWAESHLLKTYPKTLKYR